MLWEVLNALRSHDDRFDAMVNSIQLNGDSGGKLIVDIIDGNNGDGQEPSSGDGASQPSLFSLGEWKDSLYAKIVAKVGSRGSPLR